MGICQSKEAFPNEPQIIIDQKQKTPSQFDHYQQGQPAFCQKYKEEKIIIAPEKQEPKIIQAYVQLNDKESQSNKQSFCSQIEIPVATKVNMKHAFQQTSNDQQNSIMQNLKESNMNSILNSTDGIVIPKSQSINLEARNWSFIQRQQDQILQLSNTNIQQLKNFSRVRLTNEEGKLIAKNVFECFSRLVFELLAFNQQKLLTIKNDIILIDSFIGNQNVSESVLDYGQIQGTKQTKKIFLQYLVKLIKNQSSIKVLQNYYAVIGVLQVVIITYAMIQDSTIQEKYSNKQFDAEFFEILAKKFDLKFQTTEDQYVFIEGDKQLKIELTNTQQCLGYVQ